MKAKLRREDYRLRAGGAFGKIHCRSATLWRDGVAEDRHGGVVERETLSVEVSGWIGAVIWKQTRRRVRHSGLHGRLAVWKKEKYFGGEGLEAGRALKQIPINSVSAIVTEKIRNASAKVHALTATLNGSTQPSNLTCTRFFLRFTGWPSFL